MRKYNTAFFMFSFSSSSSKISGSVGAASHASV